MTQLERSIYYTEILLSHYDSIVTSPRDALQRAEERLFLACHYINGFSMESTASAMNVSRDTIYRIRRRIVARGEIPKEIHEICQNYFQSSSESRDARSRVVYAQAVREACFAGSATAKTSSTPLPSYKQTEHPGFLFNAK